LCFDYTSDAVSLYLLQCRVPIIDKYKDMGTVVMGKIESGTIREGDSLLVMPNKVKFSCSPFLRTHGAFHLP
jgi:translation elongation factor EF-1alpha